MVLTKENLQDSKTCRFCGVTDEEESRGDREVLHTSSIKENANDIKFIPIFERGTFSKNDYDENFPTPTGQTLDQLINRYLPIKVCMGDLHFPRFICSPCFQSLECTIRFFEKIIAGQRLLTRIINQLSSNSTKSQLENSCGLLENSSSLPFNNVNIFTESIPKKRGRPKKSVKNTQVHEVNAVSASSNYAENDKDKKDVNATITCTKSKRISRPPNRYMMTTFTEKSEEQSGSPTRIADLEAQHQPINTQSASEPESELEEEATTATVLGTRRTNIKCKQDTSKSDNEEVTIVKCYTGSDRPYFDSMSMLQQRRARRPGNARLARFKCQDCKKSFIHKTSLRYHRSIHHCNPSDQKQYTCEICNRSFLHKAILKTHTLIHSSERCFIQCDLCPAQFKSRSGLYFHKTKLHKTHADMRNKPIFQCDTCDKTFNLKSRLNTHLKSHTNEKPFACDFCQKSFSRKSNLLEHRRTHTKERPYRCSAERCEKAFGTRSQLKMHQFIHTGEKVYYCDICGKGMVHPVHFKTHLKRHNNQRDVVCNVCEKQFIDAWSLKTHQKRMHTIERPYICNICKRTFKDPSNLAKHKKIHAKNREEDMLTGEQEASDRHPGPGNETGKEDSAAISQTSNSEQTAQLNSNAVSVVLPQSDRVNPHAAFISVPDSTAQNASNEQDVIYIYPDNLPVFTVTLDDNQALELHGTDGSYQMLSGLGQIAFATIESADDNDSNAHYLNLELVTNSLQSILAASSTSASVVPSTEQMDSSVSSSNTSTNSPEK